MTSQYVMAFRLHRTMPIWSDIRFCTWKNCHMRFCF